MNSRSAFVNSVLRHIVVCACTVALIPGDTLAYVAARPAQASSTNSSTTKIPADQLDSLVAPIALYPDPLLAQTLAASTYPLELILLQQWLAKNPGLKDQGLAEAVAKQPWDPSVQATAGLPDVVKMLTDNVQWTTDLGNAFLAQQNDVMDAVQRMRKKAVDSGKFGSTEQQKVETRVIENKSVIVVEQENPQIVYVPSYDPFSVWGTPYYPYPPIYYPAGYYAAGLAISFGFGLAMGAFWGGGWGWGAGWGGNNININNNNNFVRNGNIGSGNRPSNLPSRGGNLGGGNRPSTLPSRGGGDSSWRHNPQHRGGAPYRDRATADRFGGISRGDSLANRQASARQQVGRQGGNLASSLPANRGLGGSGVGNRASGGIGGGADRIGSRDISRGGAGNRDAFGGGSRGSGFNGASSRASGSRGAYSGASRSGGFSGGGGGFRGGGGGARGGGGRRR
jgi:hypothetical protein